MKQVEPGRQGRFHYGWIVLAVSTVVVTGGLGFGRFAYTLILPDMKRGLALSDTHMGLIATTTYAAYLGFSFVGGYLASRYGPRLVVACSLALTGVAMFLTGFSRGVAGAALMQGLTGLGSAGTNVPTNGLASAWFSPRRRGMATGALNGGSGMGLVVTGLLVPGILNRYGELGWRYSWYYLGAIVLGLACLGYLFLRNNPAEMDLAPIGASRSEGSRVPGAGAGPLQWGLVYRSPRLWQIGLVYITFGISYVIYTTFFAEYLIAEHGVPRELAARLWSIIGLLSIASGFLWGSISDAVGRTRGLAMVFAVQATSYLIFALARSQAAIYVSAVLFGLTAWSIPAIMAAACGDYMGPRLAPASFGFITLFFGLGQMTGPYIAGRTADATGSFVSAFILAAAFSYLGSLGSLLLKPPRPGDNQGG